LNGGQSVVLLVRRLREAQYHLLKLMLTFRL
jgi:hypothetical protein